eukprot:1282952-Pyramimonas_sp.AAC.1
MFAQPAEISHIVRRGRVGQLAAARAGIPLAHRCRRALRGITLKLPATNWEPRGASQSSVLARHCLEQFREVFSQA